MTQRGLTNFKRAITRFGNKYRIDLEYGNWTHEGGFRNLSWLKMVVLSESDMNKGFKIMFNWDRSRIEIYHNNDLMAFSGFHYFGGFETSRFATKFH